MLRCMGFRRVRWSTRKKTPWWSSKLGKTSGPAPQGLMCPSKLPYHPGQVNFGTYSRHVPVGEAFLNSFLNLFVGGAYRPTGSCPSYPSPSTTKQQASRFIPSSSPPHFHILHS